MDNLVGNVDKSHRKQSRGEQKRMGAYTKEELKEKLKQAHSYESRAGHGKGHLKTEQIGTVKWKNRLYDLYEDTDRNIWFTVRVITKNGFVSEFEAIFGHPEWESERKRR